MEQPLNNNFPVKKLPHFMKMKAYHSSEDLLRAPVLSQLNPAHTLPFFLRSILF